MYVLYQFNVKYNFVQTSVPIATSAASLPGNRKDAQRLPKSSIRKSTAASASAAAGGAPVQYNMSAADSDFSKRPLDTYDSDSDELKDDPLYAPPRKCMRFQYFISNPDTFLVSNTWINILLSYHRVLYWDPYYS